MSERKYNNSDLERDLLSLLDHSGINLERAFSEKPQAIFIPKDKDRSAFYVLVTLLFNQASSKLSVVGPLVLRVASLMMETYPNYCAEGIEIMPSVFDGDRSRRIFRLSISPTGLNFIKDFKLEDLLIDKPYDGVTCGWYLDKEKYTSNPTGQP
jgi:hypothetical protein